MRQGHGSRSSSRFNKKRDIDSVWRSESRVELGSNYKYRVKTKRNKVVSMSHQGQSSMSSVLVEGVGGGSGGRFNKDT